MAGRQQSEPSAAMLTIPQIKAPKAPLGCGALHAPLRARCDQLFNPPPAASGRTMLTRISVLPSRLTASSPRVPAIRVPFLATSGCSSPSSSMLASSEVATSDRTIPSRLLGGSAELIWLRGVVAACRFGLAQPVIRHRTHHGLSRTYECPFGPPRITEVWQHHRSRSGPNGQPPESSQLVRVSTKDHSRSP